MDFNKYNQVDLDCNVDLDDDDYADFGEKTVERKIVANIDKEGNTVINKNYNLNSTEDYSQYNQIDLECNLCDDEDEEFNIENDSLNLEDDEKELIFFDSEDDELDLIQEKKTKKEIGTVEKDYWKQLSKKHSKTNVKGARGYHEVVFTGDPEENMTSFNHMMNSDVANVGQSSLNATGASSGEGCSETFNKKSEYDKLYENLLFIVGFEVDKKSENEFYLKDTCNLIPDIKCNSRQEVFNQLKPYIDDCFIYPLQYSTKQNFTSCEDWVNWYDEKTKQEFPAINKDIKYCDLIANHIEDINM